MMALQPNQKIKDPHPPADWKTVTNISAKHCVHGWRKPQHIARRQKDYDEYLRVRGVHKTKISIHRAVYRPLVAGEQPFHVPRTLKNFVQNICASFAAEHCEKDAAAKDGIDEPGGIARKQPAVTVQSCAPIGEVRFHVNLRDSPRVRHPFGDDWLLAQRLFEKIFGAEL